MAETVIRRFDRLLRAMVSGEPHKAEKRKPSEKPIRPEDAEGR
jgi:hypothetical protein